MDNFIHYNIDFEKDIKEFNKNTIFDSIVIGGGGYKGMLFLGAMQWLNEQGYLCHVNNFFGTSAGSIICLLTILGFNPTEQSNMLKINKFFSLKISKHSLFNFELPKLLKDFLNPLLTFQELFEKTGKFFFITAFNCSLYKEVTFSVIHSPNHSVFDAICYSCAVPFAFDLPINNENHIFMDGGIINNLPIDVACNFDFCHNILALSCANNDVRLYENYNFLDILNIIISLPSNQLDINRLEKYKNFNITHIECESNHGISGILLMNSEEKDILFKNGYKCIQNFFRNT